MSIITFAFFTSNPKKDSFFMVMLNSYIFVPNRSKVMRNICVRNNFMPRITNITILMHKLYPNCGFPDANHAFIVTY
jgi:hypothetical protein